MEDIPKKQINPTSIRLNLELFEKIDRDAKENRRSMTAQIEYMLLQYYKMKDILNK